MTIPYSLVCAIYPLRCRLCGTPLHHTQFTRLQICTSCFKKIVKERIKGPRCSTCGVPLISEEGNCLQCRRREQKNEQSREYYFDSHYSIFMYQDTTQLLIKAYKFDPLPAPAYLWAHFIVKELPSRYSKTPLIVPVPARKSSIRSRGWDQMELIRRILSRKYRLPTAVLLKRRGSASQKQLNYVQRMENLTGHIKYRPTNRTTPKEVLLIDDVYTTGATLDECARVLKLHGVSKVSALTIAMAPY